MCQNSVCDVTCGATNGFTLLADLGIVTVPPDYSHLTHLDSFRRNHEECFSGFNDAIRDDNFANPSRVLKPGDQFWVRAHRPLPTLHGVWRGYHAVLSFCDVPVGTHGES